MPQLRKPLMKFGIEQEVALLKNNDFADFENTSFNELQSIVEKLPIHKSDYPKLRIGDVGIKKKRWYVEGFERFDTKGNLTDCLPKGIEIRTTPQTTIEKTLQQLAKSYALLKKESLKKGFNPTWISYNPFKEKFIPHPPLNAYERKLRRSSPEAETAQIPMLTQGPDLNISIQGLSDDQLIDIGQKFTYYSPFIVPFSFSSPFYKGRLWKGFSIRTFLRTGERPAAMVFLHDPKHHRQTVPSLTQISRIDYEKGRIEFKAFDICNNLGLYHALFIVLQGLIFDTTLKGRSAVPDKALHQQAAQRAFHDAKIRKGTQEVLTAIKKVSFIKQQDVKFLKVLQKMLDRRETPADLLIKDYRKTKSIITTLTNHGNLSI